MSVQTQEKTEDNHLHSVSRDALNYLNNGSYDNRSSRYRAFSTFCEYGSELANAIEEIDRPYMRGKQIFEEMSSKPGRSGQVEEMISFLSEVYDLADSYSENNDRVLWDSRGFEIEGIREVNSILEGFADSDE